jgi:uncharacterized protein YkwD
MVSRYTKWAACFLFLCVAAGCMPVTIPNPASTGSGGTGPQRDAERLARAIHDAVNEERERRDLEPLPWNGELAEIAAGHSEDMAERSYFSHIDRSGRNPTDRAERAGFTCSKSSGNTRTYGVAENIFMASLYHRRTIMTTSSGQQRETYQWKTTLEMARETVEAWMNSPGHRANLLNGAYGNEGIGVAFSSDYAFYVTQNFC